MYRIVPILRAKGGFVYPTDVETERRTDPDNWFPPFSPDNNRPAVPPFSHMHPRTDAGRRHSLTHSIFSRS